MPALFPSRCTKAMMAGCMEALFPRCWTKPWGITLIYMNIGWPIRHGWRCASIITKVKKRKGILLEMTGQVVREDGTIAAEADAKLMYEEKHE